jgi:hypothetical protein
LYENDLVMQQIVLMDNPYHFLLCKLNFWYI